MYTRRTREDGSCFCVLPLHRKDECVALSLSLSRKAERFASEQTALTLSKESYAFIRRERQLSILLLFKGRGNSLFLLFQRKLCYHPFRSEGEKSLSMSRHSYTFILSVQSREMSSSPPYALYIIIEKLLGTGNSLFDIRSRPQTRVVLWRNPKNCTLQLVWLPKTGAKCHLTRIS